MIDYLLSVVNAAEEDGEDPDFGRPIIYLEIEDKSLVGHGANARPDFCVLRAPVRMRDECPHGEKGVVDPSRRSLDRRFAVLPEFLVGLNKIFLDEVKIACDTRRAADLIMSHSDGAFA